MVVTALHAPYTALLLSALLTGPRPQSRAIEVLLVATLTRSHSAEAEAESKPNPGTRCGVSTFWLQVNDFMRLDATRSRAPNGSPSIDIACLSVSGPVDSRDVSWTNRAKMTVGKFRTREHKLSYHM